MLTFLMSEAVRDLRRAGRVAVSATLLIMLSLGSVGAFLILADNLGNAVTTWRDRLRIIVYLRQEPSSTAANILVQRVRTFPGVAVARYVSRAEALAMLKRVLGKDAAAAEMTANPLPASIEIAPSPIGGTPEGARELIRQLSLMPEAEEVAGGVEWVDRLARMQRLATLVGLGFGAVLAVAAILTITTATTLVLHARRHETEIMRLVGAPEFTIRLPLLLQGLIQGVLGATLALAALAVVYHVAAPQVAPLLPLALGVEEISFLPSTYMVALVAVGAALGALGGFLARGRRHA